MCRLQPKPVPCYSNYYARPFIGTAHCSGSPPEHPGEPRRSDHPCCRCLDRRQSPHQPRTTQPSTAASHRSVLVACRIFFSEQAPRLSPREAHLRTCTCSPPGVATTNARLWIHRQLALQFHRRCPCCCQEYLPCLRFHIPKPSCSQPLSQLLALHPLHPPPSPCQLKCS